MGSLDLILNQLRQVGIDHLLRLEGENRHDETEEKQTRQRHAQPKHHGGGRHGKKADASGAAGGQFIVGGQAPIDHRGREERRDRE